MASDDAARPGRTARSGRTDATTVTLGLLAAFGSSFSITTLLVLVTWFGALRPTRPAPAPAPVVQMSVVEEPRLLEPFPTPDPVDDEVRLDLLGDTDVTSDASDDADDEPDGAQDDASERSAAAVDDRRAPPAPVDSRRSAPAPAKPAPPPKPRPVAPKPKPAPAADGDAVAVLAGDIRLKPSGGDTVDRAPQPAVVASAGTPVLKPRVPAAALALEGQYLGRTGGKPLSITLRFGANDTVTAKAKVTSGGTTEAQQLAGTYKLGADGSATVSLFQQDADEPWVYTGSVAGGAISGRISVAGKDRGRFNARR